MMNSSLTERQEAGAVTSSNQSADTFGKTLAEQLLIMLDSVVSQILDGGGYGMLHGKAAGGAAD